MTAVKTQYFAVIYKNNNRQYGWRCRDKDSDYSRPEECCQRKWGIRSEITVQRRAEQHLRERHGGGTIFFAYKADDKGRWPSLVVTK